MKTLKILLLGVSLLTAGSLFATGDQWFTDYEAAKKEATAKKLPILAEFSGSDWCPPCIKLNKEVFSTKEFLDYAKKNFILLFVDFPQKKEMSGELKKQNAELMKKYNVRGFPTVLILDKEGKVLNREVGGKSGGAKAYVKHLKKIKKELKL